MFDQFRKVGKIFDIDLLIMIKLYNGLLVIKFILINILGFKISDKVSKIFEYFKKSILTKWYSFKKRIPVKKTKKGGMTVLKDNYSLFGDLLFGKVIGLALFNVDWKFFRLK